MSRFTGFSEKSFLKKIWNIAQQSVGSDAPSLYKFLKGIRLHWLFHAGFGEIRFLKWRDVTNSNSWFLAILNGFSDFPFIQTNIFFLKVKRILTKNNISSVKS